MTKKIFLAILFLSLVLSLLIYMTNYKETLKTF